MYSMYSSMYSTGSDTPYCTYSSSSSRFLRVADAVINIFPIVQGSICIHVKSQRALMQLLTLALRVSSGWTEKYVRTRIS